MPIYEFACAECGHGFERLQRLSDPDPEQCPACGRPAVQRRLSAPSFRLSGSGWYETDFKGDKDKRRNLAGDGAAATTPATGSTTGGSGGDAGTGGTSVDKPADKPAAAPASGSSTAASA